jgi:DNA modification methylase
MARVKREIFDGDGASRGFYSEANRVNDLTGREWVFWTRSVITKPYPPNLQHGLRNAHGGQKPPELCADLLRVFTKAGQTVLDPFMGVGGVLLGASLSGRTALGIECDPRWIEVYREVCRREGMGEQEALLGDSREALPGLGERQFDCVLTDVPYWTMDSARRSKGAWKRVGEAASPARASKLALFGAEPSETKERWLERMTAILGLAAARLVPRGYLVTFIGDMYRANRYHCLSAELAAALCEVPGLVWKASIVWYDVSKKLHLYGYQYSYIPSLIHQNILVFRKETGG